MLFNIPTFYPPWDTGQQIYNPGTGGPASHDMERITQPRIHPVVFAVGLMGIGPMPTYFTGPSLPADNSTLSGTMSALDIPGLMKKGGG